MGLLAVVFLVALVASVLSVTVYSKLRRSDHDTGHAMIHDQLGLTAEQKKALEPIEIRCREQCRALETEIRRGNKDLAEAVLADGQDSPRVHDAIARIHAAMGELQNLTIRHVFEMRAILTPDQYKKLLSLTADALCNLDSEHAGE